MYIHQSEGWPHFTWDKSRIDSQLAVVNKAAGFLEGRLSAIGFDVQQRAAVEALTHDIVASSEIEGVILNSDQVRSSVARRMGVQITNETEPSHYIEGVVEMMLDATSGFKKPLTEDRLFGWHNCLFPTGRSGISVIDVAKYRSAGMKVVSGMFGREKVHYEAPEADQVPGEMKAFLNWFNGADTKADYIKSAIAHLWFVCIHPFDDGNGRIGRAIADMALAQADESPLRFFSMSRQINKDKKSYYDELERTSKGTGDITNWIDWYLSCMLRAIKGADEMLSSILDKAVFWQNYSQADINDRQKKVLNIYLDGYTGKLTAKNWAKHADVSPDTAVRDVQHLTEIGILVPQEGRVRNIAYGIRISENKTLLPGPKEGEE
ncbi:MAG: Fic family protein [Bacteroidales bacterium]|nr:Fic family protein [Bacteroidales bacterium]